MKKILIFLSIFLSILTLTSCFNKDNSSTNTWTTDNWLVENQVNQTSSGDQAMLWENVDYQSTIAKIKDEYKNDNVFKSCINSNVEMCLSSLVTQKASEKQDASICDDLTSPSLIEWCRTWIITSMAIASWSVEKCNELKDLNKDNCIALAAKSLALDKNDVSICKKYIIVNETVAWTWSDFVMPDMNQYNLDMCISEVITKTATNSKNIKLCDTIENEWFRSNCAFMVENQINMEESMWTWAIQ